MVVIAQCCVQNAAVEAKRCNPIEILRVLQLPVLGIFIKPFGHVKHTIFHARPSIVIYETIHFPTAKLCMISWILGTYYRIVVLELNMIWLIRIRGKRSTETEWLVTVLQILQVQVFFKHAVDNLEPLRVHDVVYVEETQYVRRICELGPVVAIRGLIIGHAVSIELK